MVNYFKLKLFKTVFFFFFLRGEVQCGNKSHCGRLWRERNLQWNQSRIGRPGDWCFRFVSDVSKSFIVVFCLDMPTNFFPY